MVQAVFPDQVHQARASAERTQGQSAAERFAVGDQVGLHAVVFLGTAVGEAKAGHHFVEDEWNAGIARDFAKSVQESGHRRQAALQRLDDHARQLAQMAYDDHARCFEIVERCHERVRFGRRIHSGGTRLGSGIISRSGGKQAADPHIVRTMVRAFELEDFRPTRGCSCDSQAVHGGFRAGGAKSHRFAGRAEADDFFRECERLFGDVREVETVAELRCDGVGHFGPSVTDQRRTPAHREIEHPPIVGRPQPATVAPRDDRGKLGRQIEFAVRAGRENC